jgi:hypothetical protein
MSGMGAHADAPAPSTITLKYLGNKNALSRARGRSSAITDALAGVLTVVGLLAKISPDYFSPAR